MKILTPLLVLSLILSVLFAIKVPFGDNPDETAHRDYIRLLISEKGFVEFISLAEVKAKFGEDAPSRDETHQPPLYYLLAVPVHAATGGSIPAVRLVSALLQLATIALVLKAGRDLLPDRPDIAVGAAAFVTCLPTQAQLGAAISNDALTTLICCAIFWRLGLLVRNGQAWKDAAIIGVLIGVGLLTKLSIIQLFPVIIAAYLIAIKAGKVTFKQAFGLCASAFAIGLVIASPWLVRNTMLYGDPLTLGIYKQTGINFTPEQAKEIFHWDDTGYARNTGIRSFATFWYFIHPNFINASPIALLIVVILSIAGTFGLYVWRRGGTENTLTLKIPAKDDRRVVLLLTLGVLLLVPFFVRFVYTVFQAQGRYFLPVLLPVALLTTLGWTQVIAKGKVSYAAALTVPVVLLILSLWQWFGGGFIR